MRTRLRVVLAAAAALAACRGSSGSAFTSIAVLAPSTEDEAAHDDLIRADISRADSVSRHGLASALSSLLTEDAIYLRGALPILRGKAAARSAIMADSASNSGAVRWQPVRAEASRDRKSGYSYGYAVYAVPQKGAASIRI